MIFKTSNIQDIYVIKKDDFRHHNRNYKANNNLSFESDVPKLQSKILITKKMSLDLIQKYDCYHLDMFDELYSICFKKE